MNDRALFIILCAICFFIGMCIGLIFRKKNKPDGTIVIEPTEDDRELMRWVLDLELDEIKEKHQILFSVEDHSKNSQSL